MSGHQGTTDLVVVGSSPTRPTAEQLDVTCAHEWRGVTQCSSRRAKSPGSAASQFATTKWALINALHMRDGSGKLSGLRQIQDEQKCSLNRNRCAVTHAHPEGLATPPPARDQESSTGDVSDICSGIHEEQGAQ